MILLKKRTMTTLLAFIVAAGCASWLACDNSKSTNPAGPDNPNLKVSKVTGTDCKVYNMSTTVPNDQDCFQFALTPSGVLLVHRVNAGFNCCPDSFAVDVDYTDRVITITECEFLTSPCRCLCLYDIDYTISGLNEGKYTIKVIEPYVGPADPVLEFDVDFSKTPSGQFCVFRSEYPWALEYATSTSGD